jgi:glucosamine--fructose-6-phosphate aminotransferase (isomerizing)
MCGIVGAVSARNVVDLLIDGIRKLEYRGYDSTGIAYVKDGHLERLRSTGRVAHLGELARTQSVQAGTGLSHTRWATHGAPTEANAHPHFSVRDGLEIGVVHNGIVENHDPIRSRMKALGYRFSSDTDTEVMAHHVHSLVIAGASLYDAVKSASREWHGAYAVAFISSREPDVVVGARQGSPLLVGLGEGENFLASDASALVPRTRTVVYLEEGDVVELRPARVAICGGDGRPVERPVSRTELTTDAVDKGPYEHYMQKEIFEQPGAAANTLEMVANAQALVPNLFGAEAQEVLERTGSVLLLACGTSYHAGLVARYWIEAIAGVPATVEIASEFRYRAPVVRGDTLVVTISQSGETADTLAAL